MHPDLLKLIYKGFKAVDVASLCNMTVEDVVRQVTDWRLLQEW